jgi:septation ring formation regulator EzrA
MSESINKNKYLDLVGLQTYDKRIKEFIEECDGTLSDAIAALDEKIGNLDIDGSNDKNLSELVDDIYNSIYDIIESQENIEEKVNDDIQKLEDHMSNAETSLTDFGARLDKLEEFEETHSSIEDSKIEDLFK